MLNSVAAGRRLARRTVLFQAVATAATALACLVLGGPPAAMGGLAGGGAVTVGSGLAAWRAMAGGIAGPGAALLRLMAGTALKWLLVLIGLVLALSVWRLPPGPVLAGAVVATLAWLPAAVFAGRADDRTAGYEARTGASGQDIPGRSGVRRADPGS